MKVTTLLVAALLGAVVFVDAESSERCKSHCRTIVGGSSEEHCGPKRGMLPRPALYNHCNEGHSAGAESACEELCQREPNTRRLDSRRLDACNKLRGYPPAERMAACNEGFVMARALAMEVVEKRRLTEKITDEDDEPKRKLSIKSQNAPKNVLEAAREEAAAAFQEAKATEL